MVRFQCCLGKRCCGEQKMNEFWKETIWRIIMEDINIIITTIILIIIVIIIVIIIIFIITFIINING